MHNPVPITLIGAGIAWLALSGAMARRGNHGGRNAGKSAHDGGGPSAIQRVKETAQSWAHEAGEAISETEERWRERAEDVGERASTAYDETVDRARQSGGKGWTRDIAFGGGVKPAKACARASRACGSGPAICMSGPRTGSAASRAKPPTMGTRRATP